MEWLGRLPPDCLCAYSDGSGAAESHSAWGFTVYFGGTATDLELNNSGSLTGAEVSDVKIHSAIAALEAITTNLSDRHISTMYVMLDNAEAAQDLRIGRATSSY
ncbi:hypothetical protein K3495_g6085 [Podosphaera aphanis]|nr:hypothetical protein K3495_g6085 [Podosphaera aphanis]